MKIRPDQIEGVRQQEQQQANKTKQPQQAFGELLQEEVTKTTGPAQAGTVLAPPPVNPLLQAQSLQRVEKVDDFAKTAVQKMDGLLNQWEEYAQQLGSADLKKAYGSLEEISGEVNQLKEEHPNMAESNPGLSQVVNELDAMVSAERFKFNRGDYI